MNKGTVDQDKYAYELNRSRPARLTIDTKTAIENDAAMVSIPAPGEGRVVAPSHFYAVSTYAPDRGSLGNVLRDIQEACDAKKVMLSRYDVDGNEVARVATPMIRSGEYQTYLDLRIEVAAIEGIPSLDNTELRVWFDGKDADEDQYILVNYRVVNSRDDKIL